jgi:hypothetical protein
LALIDSKFKNIQVHMGITLSFGRDLEGWSPADPDGVCSQGAVWYWLQDVNGSIQNIFDVRIGGSKITFSISRLGCATAVDAFVWTWNGRWLSRCCWHRSQGVVCYWFRDVNGSFRKHWRRGDE